MASLLRKLFRKFPFNLPVLAVWFFKVLGAALGIWIIIESIAPAINDSRIGFKTIVALVIGVCAGFLAKAYFDHSHFPQQTGKE